MASAEPRWDETVDLLVVGSGIGGLATAIIAASRGVDVLVVEKAARLGGTTRKSAGYAWVPNNHPMRAAGIDDPRPAALRYMARLARPLRYDAEHETLGLPAWEHEAIAAHYDHAGDAFAELESLGAVRMTHAAEILDYHAQIAENEAPAGRTFFPADGGGGPTGGQVLVDGLVATATELGCELRPATPVTRVVTDDAGAVIGAVTGTGPDARTIRTRIGVLFASGGFVHDEELRTRHLDHPYVGGCSARSNVGDFVRLAAGVGADLANLNLAMRAPIVVERMLREPDDVIDTFVIPGDAMVVVDRRGRRVHSEAASYHDIARAFFTWDPHEATYSSIPLIAIWDQRVHEEHGGDGFGNPVPAAGRDPYWVVTADDLDGLEAGIRERLEGLRGLLGGADLYPEFGSGLRETLRRFARFAATGVDEDFGRGSLPGEVARSGTFGPLGDGANPSLRAFDETGPYHATILGPALFETAGGPRADTEGRILRPDGSIVRGLYGVGACVASPSGESYWSAGHTIGYVAARAYQAAVALAETRTSAVEARA